jgi:uncharacterized DUF497 family protein
MRHGAEFDLIGAILAGKVGDFEDARRAYGEARMTVFGLVAGRLLCATDTMRGAVLRVISLRKVNEREQRE